MFSLKRPCKNCPFTRKCLKGWLGKARTEELAEEVIHGDEFFICHNTLKEVDEDEFGEMDGTPLQEGHQFCAGALILAERVNPGGNRNIRLAKMYGICKTEEISGGAEVFSDVQEFIKHHT